MSEARVEQLFLVPGQTKAETAVWGAAVMEYAAYFPGVTVSHDYTDALRPEFERIVVIQPDYWPEDLWLLIKQNLRRMTIEKLEAATPEALAEILHKRVFYGLRYGFEGGDEWTQQWPAGVSLIGLHGRSDGNLQGMDYDVVRTARIEAVKLTSHADPLALDRLRDINPGLFIMVRPIMAFHDDDRPRHLTPADFLSETGADLQALFDHDPAIKYVEVHNEPNLMIEGLGGSWNNGHEFGAWFSEAVELMRQRWPDKKYGFPGLSPGDSIRNVRQSSSQFLNEALIAAAHADWIGVHGYWQSEAELTSLRDGFTWKGYRDLFPDRLLFVTEFGNPTQPKSVVAQQYAQYYGMLRHVGGIGGVFSYVVSTSNPFESPRWAWRDESGQDVGIAHEVGLRKYIR